MRQIERELMNSITYRQIPEPRSEQVTEILDGLNSFGLKEVRGEEPAKVAVVCDDRNRRVIGGAIGHSLLQRFYLTQLWVLEEHRSKGLGSELVARMEVIASKSNCRDIVVDTLNKKALLFYERLGYKVYIVNPNYIQGFDWHFLAKAIQPNLSLQSISGSNAPVFG
jgi:ribosomal protein S18 acetylase RimI-like enzyme